MTKRKTTDDAEKKRKKKEYDRLRRLKMKKDPILAAEQKKKEHLKYKRKIEKKQVKLVKDMTPRERRVNRKLWREKFRKWYHENKPISESLSPSMSLTSSSTAQTPPDENKRARQIAFIAKRRVRKNHYKVMTKNKKLEEEIKIIRRAHEKLKKRIQRMKQVTKNCAPSPRKKIASLMKSGTPQEITRRLLVGETLRDGLAKYYKRLDEKGKVFFRNKFNSKFLRKYRILNQMNFISSNLFHNNFARRSNNSSFRMHATRVREQVIKDVTTFFEDDENSRMCPGKKDCITRKKVKKQKRLLSDSVKGLHKKFCQTMNYKLSYSTFCKLKPFWIVSQKATARDTCVCRVHENMKELVSSLHKAKILYSDHMKEILSSICCDTSSPACLQRKCVSCKDLMVSYQPYDDGGINYHQWTTRAETYTAKDKTAKAVKHVVKEKVTSSIMDAVDVFEKNLKEFMEHEAVMIHQFRAIRQLKERLFCSEVLIHCDFSENYNFKYGREIQSMHFGGSRKQITLHTVQIYYKRSVSDKTSSQAFCTLSESLEHGPAAVWAHLGPVFEYIKQNLPDVSTYHFLSDSPSTQYRNKSIFFLISTQLTTAKAATWNYSAAGHGKGAVDGIGGCLKRTADQIVGCGDDIGSFDVLVEALKRRVKNVHIHTVHHNDIAAVSARIPSSLSTFKGTMKTQQVVYDSSKPQLKMNRLSCVDCLNCLKFKIGFYSVPLAVALQLPSSSEEQPRIKRRTTKRVILFDSVSDTPAKRCIAGPSRPSHDVDAPTTSLNAEQDIVDQDGEQQAIEIAVEMGPVARPAKRRLAGTSRPSYEVDAPTTSLNAEKDIVDQDAEQQAIEIPVEIDICPVLDIQQQAPTIPILGHLCFRCGGSVKAEIAIPCALCSKIYHKTCVHPEDESCFVCYVCAKTLM